MKSTRRVILSLAFLFAVATHGKAESWEKVNYGFYEGNLVNLWQPSVANGAAEAVDMDGDGDLDLLIGGNFVGVRYFRNDGSRTNPSWTHVTDNLLDMSPDGDSQKLDPAAADLDGDGDPDIVVANCYGKVYYYRNDGESGFLLVTTSLVANYGYNLSVELADMDGDGKCDLLLAVGGGNPTPTANTGKLFLFRNIGSTTSPAFGSPEDMGLPNNGQYFRYITACDLDADGDYDIVTGRAEGSVSVFPPYRTELFRNVGSPTAPSFVLETTQYFDFISTQTWVIPCAIDSDGDGDFDFLFFHQYHSGLGLYGFARNTGNVSHPEYRLEHGFFHSFTRENLSSNLALGDLDNDGDLDAIQGGQGNPKNSGVPFAFFRNEGSPLQSNWVLSDREHIPFPGDPTHSLLAPLLFDIDADGDLDLFAIEQPYYYTDLGPRIHFWRNTGSRSAPEWVLESRGWHGIKADSIPSEDGNPVLFTNPSFGDIDGDGPPDLAVGAVHTKKVYWYKNIGTISAPLFDPNSPMILVSVTAPGSTSWSSSPCLVDTDLDGDLDLIVGVDGAYDVRAQVNFFRNSGTPQNPQFVLENAKWQGRETYAYIYVPVRQGDIDGDGLPNIFISDANGGIVQYRAVLPTLSVYPRCATILSGATVDFVTSGQVGVVSAMTVENRSSGSLTGLTYTAGLKTGVVDKIKFTDSGSSMTAYAYVNVISSSQLAASGKAVVMAGRKQNDPLWDTATNRLAHFIYRMLLYRGFSKENVQYLNPVTGQDVFGDNVYDHIDAASSLANIDAALSTFAANSPNLFVYLIDHGDADANGANGYIRCNETDILTAAHLDALLDDLQENHGVTTLTLVVDCCTAGSFLPVCSGAPAGKTRVVICSAGATQPAFFSAAGLISFTNAFVSALCSGLPVGHAFDLGAGAMDRYQQPIMDDDGSGVYNKDMDGAIADNLTVGASFIAGADRPQIGVISPNQALTGGDASATIWASDVSAVYPVDRVWASIARPDLIPDAQLDPSTPITGLPELDMAWNASANRYEATTDTFTQLGAYRINIYAEDIWSGVSYPKQTYINQTESDERMIVVCGTGAYDANSPWDFSDYLADSVYETARARWIADDKIAYLSSASDSRVDNAPTQANLSTEISSATGIGKLTVYLVGRGDAAAFDIDGDGVASDADDVTPAELDGWLDDLQNTSPTRVIVVLDFTQSGAWVALLVPPTGKQRIVITSCSGAEASWCEAGGMLSFTQWFFSEVFNGVNVRDSFNWARVALQAVTGYTQNATLDDDGSGVANKWDGALAKTTYIGAAFVTAAEPPTIGDYAKDVVLTSTQALLWASNVSVPDGLSEVFAYVVRPGTTPTEDHIDRVDLAYNATNGRWEATYSTFDAANYFKVIYFAKDRNDQLSQPYATIFGSPDESDIYDRFYADDTTATLNFFSNDNFSQEHNLWLPGDEDWAVFNADPNGLYTIKVSDQGTSCDAIIYLYHESNLTTPVLWVDGWGPGEADEILSLNTFITSAGTYYVRVTQSPFGPDMSGYGTSYTLRITGDWGDSAGLATITGTKLKVDSDGKICLMQSGGLYSKDMMVVPKDALSSMHEFIIDDPGDVGNSPHFEPTKAWRAAHPNNASLIWILSESPVTFAIPATIGAQFINDGPTTQGFTIDDIPVGANPWLMRVHSWNGASWEVVSGAQNVWDATTVSASIASLGNVPHGDCYMSVFGVAPVLPDPVEPLSLNFVADVGTSVTKSITVRNFDATSASAVSVHQVSGDTGVFGVTTALPMAIAADSSATLGFTFEPKANASYQAAYEVTIRIGAVLVNSRTVQLTGHTAETPASEIGLWTCY